MIQRLRARLVRAAFATACGTCFLGCSRGGEDPTPEDVEVVVLPENVATVHRERLRVGPRILGSLEPAERAVLRAEVSGTILSVHADTGESVRRGRTLSRIDTGVLEESVRSARTSVSATAEAVRTAERELARTRRLVAAGAVARRELEIDENAVSSARAQFEEARARLAAAQEQLASTTIQSPIDGVVGQRHVSEGDVVAVGAELFTILDPSSLRLEATVPSEHLVQIAPGTTVLFDVQGFPAVEIRGRIEQILPEVEPETRQVRILVTVPNPDRRLLAGLFARGRVITDVRSALVVPMDAVRSTADRSTVVQIVDGRAIETRIEVGLTDELTERLEAVAGLAEGDRILRGQGRNVEPGTRVRIASPRHPGKRSTSDAAAGADGK